MRAGFGSLLIVYFEGDRLVFWRKVGTGFTYKLAVDLRGKLDRIEKKVSPFRPPPAGPLGRNAHWVKPDLVCEVVFTEWTKDGKIRHPSFQGLRADKKPAQVTRETPASADPPPSPRRGGGASGKAPRGPEVAGVVITHPDRALYREPKLTKLDLARYY